MQFLLGFVAALALAVFPGVVPTRTKVTTAGGKSASFAGLVRNFPEGDAKAHTLKLLYVHGMGAPPDYSARDFTRAIALRLGMHDEGVEKTTELALPAWCCDVKPAHVNLRRYARANGDRIEIYEVIWSPLIYESKIRMLVQEEQANLGERVRVNGRLKDYLMNQRMADPVMYLGELGPVIRNAVKQTICTQMLTGKIEGDLPHERCSEVTIEPATSFAVITESLGSCIAFDAISELDRDSPAATESAAAQFLGQTSSFFMLANQLPLLRLRSAGARQASIATVLDATSRNRFPLEIITISDPNDVLSYPIPASLAAEYPKHTFINVRTRLAWKLLSGLAAYPKTAHTGHTTNQRVIDMIARGWRG